MSDLIDICKTFQLELTALTGRIQAFRLANRFESPRGADKIVNDNLWYGYRNIDAARSNFGSIVEALGDGHE